MNFAIIHAGPAAPSLKRLLTTLESVGVSEKTFMCDLIATLRYEEDFKQELNTLLDELIFGEYYHHRLSHGDIHGFQEYTTRFMDETAVVSARVARYLHTTLVTQGIYTNDGKFPHEFHSFDGRVISLRSL